MALTAIALANKIKTANNNIDVPSDALKSFWDAICEYIEASAQVTYSWIAFSPPPASTPDPINPWIGRIKTSGSLSLCNLSSPDGALAAMSSQMNLAAATWVIEPPTGFALSPMFVIPTIKLNKSGATDRDSALLSIATDIINGLKTATPVTTGAHGAYTGTGTFVNIL